MAAVLPRRPRAAVRAAAAALGLLLGLAGCSAAPAPPHAADQDAALRALLGRRAAAVMHRDRAAFLAGVDPSAGRFAAAQRQVFANLAGVPLAAWSYTLVRTGAFPIPAAADGAARTAAEVRLSYRIGGYDAQPVESTAYLTFDRRGGRWYLAADDDGAQSGHRGDAQLWDQGPVQVVRGAHSLVLGLGARSRLQGYATAEDAAVPEVA